MIKKLFSLVLIFILLVSNSFAQEEVIIKKEYMKFEYINEAKSGTNPRAEFFGWALIGSAYSSARWRVMKISYDMNDTDFRIEWADGDTSFDNVIANYPTLSYQ